MVQLEQLQVDGDVGCLKQTQCLCGLSCITPVGRGIVAQALYGFHKTSLRHDSTSHMFNAAQSTEVFESLVPYTLLCNH